MLRWIMCSSGVLILVLFVMIRRPPRSTRTDTLFPYTTLFRSSTVDERQNDYLAAEAELIGTGVALERARLDLEYTEIRAPITGRIDRHRTSIGNLVEPNDTILTSTVSLDPTYVYFDNRSEGSSVGKEGVRTCSYPWPPEHYKQTHTPD